MYDVTVTSEILEAIAAFVGLGIVGILVLPAINWLLVLVVVLVVVLSGALIYRALREGPTGRHSDRVNCPACGSRISSTEITCEYCGEEL